MKRTVAKGAKTKKSKSIVILSLLSVIVAAVAFFSFVSFEITGTIYDYKAVISTIKLGIDLEGGVYVVLEPDETDEGYIDAKEGESVSSVIDSSITKIRARLDAKGFTEATISKQAGNAIRIEIPAISSPEEVFSVIGSTGKLTFKVKDNERVYLEGKDVKKAYTAYDNDGKPVVAINFTNHGAKLFEEATGDAIGKSIVITLDDEVISDATVSQKITGGKATISSDSMTIKDADNLAILITSGSLPIKFIQTESRTISSAIGETALRSGLLASGIGLLLIFLFMAFIYKGFGLIANYSLVIYILLLLITLAYLPWVQMTLAGIAGVILGIGMAVDANIIIFESIKEEFKSGKTVEAAIKAGFRKSTVAIADANITTLIAAVVLWILGTGSIMGFAITFFLSIILSLFTSLLVARFTIKLFLPLLKNKEKFLGLKRGEETNA